MESTNRIELFDITKGILIILMVLGHCIQYGSGIEYGRSAFLYNPLFIFIYSFHMPLFMVISGYFFANSMKKRTWMEVLIKKAKQLIIPLLSWSIVTTIVSICKSGGGISITWIMRKYCSGFINGPWFLWAIWWSSFAIVVIHKFFKDNKFVYSIGILLTFVMPDFYGLALYKFMFPYYLFGYVFNVYNLKSKIKWAYFNCYFIIITICFILLLPFYNYDSYIYFSGYTIMGKNIVYQLYNDCFRFIIGLVGSISILCSIYYVSNMIGSGVKRLIIAIGNNTMGIYIISGYLFDYCIGVFNRYITEINYLYIMIELVVILLISYLGTKLLQVNKYLNILLLGGR